MICLKIRTGDDVNRARRWSFGKGGKATALLELKQSVFATA